VTHAVVLRLASAISVAFSVSGFSNGSSSPRLRRPYSCRIVSPEIVAWQDPAGVVGYVLWLVVRLGRPYRTY